jgi:predicted transcriptional regulator
MGPNTKGKGARLLGPQTKGKVARHLLIVDTASILAYKEAGWSAKNIAERLGRDKDTINRVLATLKATLDKGIPRQKKGL